jgi:hypothetical protein
VADGDDVEVGNGRGSFVARAVIDDVARPGVAVTTKGRWPKRDGGATVNATTCERQTDTGGPTFHDNRVTVTLIAGGPPGTAPSQQNEQHSDNGDRTGTPASSTSGAGNLGPWPAS